MRHHESGIGRKGLYVKVGDDFLGIYDTADGPKLFYNRDKYLLTEGDWDVELMIGKESNLFIFYWKGEVKISLRHNKHQEPILRLYRMLQE